MGTPSASRRRGSASASTTTTRARAPRRQVDCYGATACAGAGPRQPLRTRPGPKPAGRISSTGEAVPTRGPPLRVRCRTPHRVSTESHRRAGDNTGIEDDRLPPGDQEGFTLVELMIVLLGDRDPGRDRAAGLPGGGRVEKEQDERRTQAELRDGASSLGSRTGRTAADFTGFAANCTAVADSCTVRRRLRVGPRLGRVRAAGDLPGVGRVRVRRQPAATARTSAGEFFCIAQSSGQTDHGRGVAFSDIDTMPECTGGW